MQDAIMECRIDLDSISSALLFMSNAYDNDGVELSAEEVSKCLFGLHRYLETVNTRLEEIDLNYDLVKRNRATA